MHHVSNYCTGIQTLYFLQVLDDSAGQLLTVLDIEIADFVMEATLANYDAGWYRTV
jgi:hypothetical protein